MIDANIDAPVATPATGQCSKNGINSTTQQGEVAVIGASKASTPQGPMAEA